eukprot:3932939-Rhodomonas_salina.2
MDLRWVLAGCWRSEGDLDLDYVFQDGDVFVYQVSGDRYLRDMPHRRSAHTTETLRNTLGHQTPLLSQPRQCFEYQHPDPRPCDKRRGRRAKLTLPPRHSKARGIIRPLVGTRRTVGTKGHSPLTSLPRTGHGCRSRGMKCWPPPSVLTSRSRRVGMVLRMWHCRQSGFGMSSGQCQTCGAAA